MRPIEELSRRPSLDPSADGTNTPRALRVVDDKPAPQPITNGNDSRKDKPAPIEPPSRHLAPIITTTLPSPSIPQEETLPTPSDKPRPRRSSFHPAPVNTAFSREVLLTSRTGVLPGTEGVSVDSEKEAAENALLSNVEEMLEGFDWTAGVGSSAKKGSADAIESRLLDELAALDSVSLTDLAWTRS